MDKQKLYIRNNKYLKAPNTTEYVSKAEYTRRVDELVKCMENVDYFAETYFTIISPGKGKHIIELYEKQRQLIHTLIDEDRIIALAARQTGKCHYKDTLYKIRNKRNRRVLKITAEKFHKLFLKLKNLTNKNDEKFIETFKVHDYQVYTDTGWVDIVKTHKTKKYKLWIVRTNYNILVCADEHILFDENYNEIFVKDLNIGNYIISRYDIEKVIDIQETNEFDYMYDLELPINSNHRYYTNNLLSHNTTSYNIFSLWTTMFQEDKRVLICANKEKAAKEFLSRIRLAYELIPLWLKPGVIEWNKTKIVFDNGSSISASATSADSARGESCNILIIDEAAFIPFSIMSEFQQSVFPVVSSAKGTKIIMVSCVTDDTMVLTSKGPKQVSDFIDYNKQGAYFSNDYSLKGYGDKLRTNNIIVNNGKVLTKKIKTSYSSLEGSYQHKLWVKRNNKQQWIKLKNIEIGDQILIEYGKNIWGNNDKCNFIGSTNKFKVNTINKNLAYFLGLFIAEGSIYKRKYNDKFCGGTVTITCGDYKNVIESIKKIGFEKYYLDKDKLRCSISSKDLIEFLEYLGFNLSLKANQKIIPSRLLEMSKENISAMLQGIFDGDGYSSLINNYLRVGINLSSKKLINQIRNILNNFGILSYYYEGITPKTNIVNVTSNYYKLEIRSQKYVKLFYDLIGFKFNRKQKKRKFIKKRIIGNNISVSVEIVKQILKENNLTLKQAQKQGLNLHRFLYGDVKTISEFTCQKLQLLDKNNLLENIISTKNIWDTVNKIEDSENYTYDFSLNQDKNDKWCHSIFYNGLLGHQTPNGKGNLYYETYNRAVLGIDEDGWKPVRIDWRDVPGRDEEWKRKQIASFNGDMRKWAQEFGNCFHGSSYTLLNDKLLRKIEKTSLQYKINPKEIQLNENIDFDIKIWKRPIKNRTYVIGADTAEGVGGDYSTILVFDITKYDNIELVCSFGSNTISTTQFAYLLAKIGKMYNKPYIAMECNSIGKDVISDLVNLYMYDEIINYPGDKRNRFGIFSHNSVKVTACHWLKTLFNDELFNINLYDKNIVYELQWFEKKDKTSKTVYQAVSGRHDDYVMSLIWAMFVLKSEILENYYDVKQYKTNKYGHEIPYLIQMFNTSYYEDTFNSDDYNKINEDEIFSNILQNKQLLNEGKPPIEEEDGAIGFLNDQNNDFINDWNNVESWN